MTIHNPIIRAVAQEAAANDKPISVVTVTAPLITGSALLAIAWSGLESGPCDLPDLPSGVTGIEFCCVPDTIVHLPPMVDAEGMSIGAAWAHGAWDINRTTIPAGYYGPLPPSMAAIADSVREQGYVSWHWRPQMRGPEIRAQQKRPDLTLDKWTRGRDGSPPQVSRPPIIAGRSVLIKLGDDGTRPRDRERRPARSATASQRDYLQDLLRKDGEDDALPDDLDMRAASAWIDRLTGQVPSRPPAKPRKRSVPITVNQWWVIDDLMRRLARKGLPPNTMRLMTYDEAQAMILDLNALLAARAKGDAA